MVMFIPKKGLSATEHAELDHSEIPGCGEEAFDEAAHALVDHSTQLGVPSIAGLLDETAHDALDHTGLTGIPDEFDWDMDAATPHRLVDHSGIPGVATEEAFDAAAHALTDHSTQLGVPSIAGLLDESAHDDLDHAGLTGVGDVQFKSPVATAATLPVNTETLRETIGDTSTMLAGMNAWVAEAFTGRGLADYKFTVKPINFSANVIVHVYTNNGGNPGTAVYSSASIPMDGTPEAEVSFVCESINLTNDASYFLVLQISNNTAGIAFRSAVFGSGVTKHSTNGVSWSNLSRAMYLKVYTTTILSYEGDVRAALDTNGLYYFNGTDWDQIGDLTGLLDETAHDALDHAGLTGVPNIEGLLDESAHDLLDHTGLTGIGGGSDYFVDPVAAEANLPSSDNNDGDLIVAKDSHKIYIWDAEASTPCWRETNREITHENVTVDASSWRNFQISLIDRSMLNILDFECIISKIAITAIDGNATPAMDYNIELFTDSSRTVYAYWAQNIDTVLFEDKIPFLWEGGSTVYGRIVNNAASAITDLNITIKYRV